MGLGVRPVRDGKIYTIGRNIPEDGIYNDLTFDASDSSEASEFVSRRHFSLTKKGKMITISDLYSANGTHLYLEDPDLLLNQTVAVRPENVSMKHTNSALLRRKLSTVCVNETSMEKEEGGKPCEDNGFSFISEDKSMVISGVFDGMGGHRDGAKASKIVNNAIFEFLADLNSDTKPNDIIAAIKLAFEDAVDKIQKKLGAKGSDGGTTATFAVVKRKSKRTYEAFVANAGDSRAYVLTGGKLMPLTVDNHVPTKGEGLFTLEDIQQLAKKSGQLILSRVNTIAELIKYGLFEKFRRRNIVDNVITASKRYTAQPVITRVMLKSDDRLLFSTDGIHDNLTDGEIEQLLKKTPDVYIAAKKILEAAREISKSRNIRGKDDDASVIVTNLE